MQCIEEVPQILPSVAISDESTGEWLVVSSSPSHTFEQSSCIFTRGPQQANSRVRPVFFAEVLLIADSSAVAESDSGEALRFNASIVGRLQCGFMIARLGFIATSGAGS